MKNLILLLALLPSWIMGQDTLNVFFIGNSYTAYNNLPQLVSQMAAANGQVLMFYSHTPGGNTLEQHASNPMVINRLNSHQYDYVVLQEQSQKPSFPPAQVATEVLPFAESLVNEINATQNCAQAIFYMTWGRENGDQANCPFYPPLCTYEGMQQRLRESYLLMANDNNSLVSPVGAIWQQVRIADPTISLYTSDGSHPNIVGSFLAAHAFYGAFYHELPPVSYLPNGVTPAQQNLIRNATQLVLFDSIAQWNIDTNSLALGYNNLTDTTAVMFVNSGSDSCQWTVDGQTYTGDTLSFTANWSDSINITQTVYKAPCDSLSQTFGIRIHDKIPSSVKTAELIPAKVFPNPAKNVLYIEGQHLIKSYEIYDLSGRVIQFGTPENNRVDISKLKSGLYFLRFSNFENITYFSDFLKID